MIVIADSDAILAGLFSSDTHFTRTHKQAAFLANSGALILYPNVIVVEAITTIQRKLNNHPKAIETAKSFNKNSKHISEVTPDILKDALEIFVQTTSKKNTLFDCIVCAFAQKYKADAIFSFDKFYQKMGFKLVSDIIK